MATSSGGSYPQIFYPNGSGVENKSSGFVTGNSSDPAQSDTKNIKIDLPSNANKRAVESNGVTSIARGASQALVSVSGFNGLMALDLGTPVPTGTVVCVSGAYPLAGCYEVVSTSGNLAITSTPYLTCVSTSGTETWNTSSGSIDPACQGHPSGIIRVDDVCRISQNGSSASRKINSFRSYVYTDECWRCFCGTADPCDRSLLDMTFWTDQSDTDANVHFVDSVKIVEGNSSGYNSRVGVNNPSGENFTG